VRILYEYGLAERDKSLKENGIESRGYSMHNCVHSWTIHVLNQEWEAEMAKTALECVGTHVPSGEEPKYWVMQRRLIRHAARCWDMVVKGVVKGDAIAAVLINANEIEKVVFCQALGCGRRVVRLRKLPTMDNGMTPSRTVRNSEVIGVNVPVINFTCMGVHKRVEVLVE